MATQAESRPTRLNYAVSRAAKAQLRRVQAAMLEYAPNPTLADALEAVIRCSDEKACGAWWGGEPEQQMKR